MTEASRIQGFLKDARDGMRDMLLDLARIESPTDDPQTLARPFTLLAAALADLGMRVEMVPGAEFGGVLYARPRDREKGAPTQLLLGHMDTVWPVGTLGTMPVEADAERVRGPGTYDMKAGLVQAVYALRALDALDLPPSAVPVLLVNSDEELGSKESTRWVRRLAKVVCRAYVLEPSAGLQGALKTGRKGIGRFTVTAHGKAAHAGLDPTAGASAILELSHQIQRLFALNDPVRGVSVNVGTIDGGMRANVVAPWSQCVVDVRVPTNEDARAIEAAIHGLTAVTPGVRLEIEGNVGRPPMEPDGARHLWEEAQGAAAALGIELTQAFVGGASDGNTTSQSTPTLDGLGAVGDGAHAAHEFVLIDRMVERAALLALLLRAPTGGPA
ncbi:MAG: M20 family metallopeptidase [Alphaproteobacteria bacterium]|nr:M20 family metallopeptidase [Alphaproteobacteria bacterium]